MPSQTKTHIYQHSCENLFNLVANIESYPEFLPWCEAARIKSKNGNIIIADLVICFKGITETYSSEVILTPGNEYSEINVKAINGPFKKLNNSWKFNRISENETKVSFEIDFILKSSILNAIISQIFQKAYDTILESFEQRANEIYNNNTE